MRQAKGGDTKSGLGQIVDTVSIRERPAEALRTAPCQVTGKVIFSPGRTTRPSRPWSNAIPALSCASQDPEQGHRNRGRRTHQTCAQTAAAAAPLLDLGSR